MFITIINDCADYNAKGRQETRAIRLFNAPVSFVGIDNYSELEAAGILIDMLDASDGEEGVILVNSAPRHGRGKKWPNGTPFGYFFYKKTLIVSTIAEQTLSLVKKFGLLKELHLTDVPTVVDKMIEQGKLDANLRDLISKSQFRSYDYMPRVAKWVLDEVEVPNEIYPVNNIMDAPKSVWLVDNFGNCKTTLLPEDIDFQPGKVIKTKVGEITCYTQLKDVPNDEHALTIGSSGLGDKRFIELVIQGKNASKFFNLKSGSELL